MKTLEAKDTPSTRHSTLVKSEPTRTFIKEDSLITLESRSRLWVASNQVNDAYLDCYNAQYLPITGRAFFRLVPSTARGYTSRHVMLFLVKQ
ncbi:hypothetical protein QYF36_003326 [Acer negundo]|nr:hypothetical protein QYF36_003326 [Acer negundo]